MKGKSKEKLDIVITPFLQDIVDRAILYLKAGYAVHFSGPSGVGKTTLAIYIAQQLNKPHTLIQGNPEISNTDLIGSYVGFTNKKIVDNFIHSVYKEKEESKALWSNGKLIEALEQGHTFIYDEFNRSSPEVNNLFLSVLEERKLTIYGTNEKGIINVNPEFSMILTSNPKEYAGIFLTQDALLDRVITISLNNLDKETEREIIMSKANITTKEANILVQILNNIRKQSPDYKNTLSLRPGIMIGMIAKNSNIPIDTKNAEFNKLCTDILSFKLSNILELSEKDIAKIIAGGIKNVQGELVENEQ